MPDYITEGFVRPFRWLPIETLELVFDADASFSKEFLIWSDGLAYLVHATKDKRIIWDDGGVANIMSDVQYWMPLPPDPTFNDDDEVA